MASPRFSPAQLSSAHSSRGRAANSALKRKSTEALGCAKHNGGGEPWWLRAGAGSHGGSGKVREGGRFQVIHSDSFRWKMFGEVRGLSSE